jgi:hypothetical protein
VVVKVSSRIMIAALRVVNLDCTSPISAMERIEKQQLEVSTQRMITRPHWEGIYL